MPKPSRIAGGAALALAAMIALTGCAAGADEPAEPEETTAVEEEVVELEAPTAEQLAAAVPSGDALADYGWAFDSAEATGRDDVEASDDESCISSALGSMDEADAAFSAHTSWFTRGTADRLSFEVRHYPTGDPLDVVAGRAALADCPPETVETADGATSLQYVLAEPAPAERGDATLGLVANVEYVDYAELGALRQAVTIVACGDLLLIVSGSTATAELAAADMEPVVDRAMASLGQAVPDRC